MARKRSKAVDAKQFGANVRLPMQQIVNVNMSPETLLLTDIESLVKRTFKEVRRAGYTPVVDTFELRVRADPDPVLPGDVMLYETRIDCVPE